MLDINLKITPEIIEQHYFEFSDMFLAAYAKVNFEIYKSDTSTGYLKRLIEADIDARKEINLINKKLKKKNIEILAESLDQLFDIIGNNTLTKEWILESEYSRFVQACLLYINDFYELDYELYFEDDVAEQVEFISEYMLRDQSLLTYLAITYEYNQINKSDMDEIRKNTLKNLHTIYLKYIVSSIENNSLAKSNAILLIELDELNKEVNRKDKVIVKSKKKLEQLRNDHESNKKKMDRGNNETIKSLETELQALKHQYSENQVKFENRLANMVPVDKYNQKVIELKNLHNKYCERGKRISELDKLNKQLSDKSEIQMIESYLKENGITKEFYQLLHIYYDPNGTGIMPEVLLGEIKVFSIGYCRMANHTHYIVDAKGAEFKILNLPEDVYLSEGQFIMVSSKHVFVKSYPYRYEAFNDVDSFVEVSSINPLAVYTPNNSEANLSYRGITKIRKGEIIPLYKGELVHEQYRPLETTLGNLVLSIETKGHQLVYITKKLANGYIVFNILTGVEEVVQGLWDEILLNKIVTLNKEGLVKVLDRDQFLFDPLLLPGVQKGIYEIDDEQKYIRLEDGTRLLFSAFNLCPTLYKDECTEGDIFEIDRFNNIIRSLEVESLQKKSIARKVTEHKKFEKKEKNPTRVETQVLKQDTILIVGSLALSNSYKMNFLKQGYKVDVVSGHDPYFKIAKKAHKSDLVIFVTTSASHENYYMIKDEFKDKVYYCHDDGANRLVELVCDLSL